MKPNRWRVLRWQLIIVAALVATGIDLFAPTVAAIAALFAQVGFCFGIDVGIRIGAGPRADLKEPAELKEPRITTVPADVCKSCGHRRASHHIGNGDRGTGNGMPLGVQWCADMHGKCNCAGFR